MAKRDPEWTTGPDRKAGRSRARPRAQICEAHVQAWQEHEESLHVNGTSITGVRLWPVVVPLLEEPEQAQRREFIEIVCAYKIAFAEANSPRTADAINLKRWSRLLKEKQVATTGGVIESLGSTVHGQRALVMVHHELRRLGDNSEVPLSTILQPCISEDPLSLSRGIEAIETVAGAIKSRNKGRRGNPAKPARSAFLRAMVEFVNCYGRLPVYKGNTRNGQPIWATDFIQLIFNLSERLATDTRLSNDCLDTAIKNHRSLIGCMPKELNLGSRDVILKALMGTKAES